MKRIPLIGGGIVITAAVLFGFAYLVEQITQSDNGTLPPAVFTGAPAVTEEESFEAETAPENENENYKSYFKSLLDKKKKQSGEVSSASVSTSVPDSQHGGAGREPPPGSFDDIPLYKEGREENGSSVQQVYKVQLGSFTEMQHAQWFSEKLAAKGYEPYIVEKKIPGKGMVYRVRIGKFSDMEEAKKLAARLEDDEDLTAFITSR